MNEKTTEGSAAPMGSRPKQKRGLLTRRKLIDAAVKVFTRDTVEGSRIEDIIEEAGVSRGTFFHYFPRKEDLLLSIAAEEFTRVREALEKASQDPDKSTRDVLEAGFVSIADTNAPPHLYSAVLQEVTRQRRRFHAMIGEGTPTFLDAVADAVARGQEKGEVRGDLPPMLLAVMINSMVLSPLINFPAMPELPMRSLIDLIPVYMDVLWKGIESRDRSKR